MNRTRAIVVGLFVALPLLVQPDAVSAIPPPADTFHGLVPARLLDTRPTGSTIDHDFEKAGPVGPNSITNVPILNRGGVPAEGVGSVALNVTGVGPSTNSFVTVWPKGFPQPDASNLNLQAGVTTPNMVIVPVGDDGQISLFNKNGTTNLLVDVLGWFPDGPSFIGFVPVRVMDTRPTGATVDHLFEKAGPVGPNSVTNLTIGGRPGFPESNEIDAVALNVTGTGPSANTFITVWPAGSTQPDASNLNLRTGVTTPNMVIVPLGVDGQISLFNKNGNTNLLVDILGFFPAGDSFTGLVPARLMDTRPAGQTIDHEFEGDGAVGPNSVTNLIVTDRGGIPADAAGAVALNVTGTNPTANSFVTVWPTGETQPDASTLNLRTGITTPNMVIVPIGVGGQISLFNKNGSTDLLVDVLGWFPNTVVEPSTVRASVDSAEVEALSPGTSSEAAISGDGRYVVFSSTATNLVAGDDNGLRDIFRRDLLTGTTTRVNTDSTNHQAQGGDSTDPAISADGRFIAYQSSATNLLGVGIDTNAVADVYVYDAKLFTTSRASVSSGGGQVTGGASGTPSISADGRYVAFESDATVLVPSDSNNQTDVFVHDLETLDTVRVSVDSEGNQTPPGSGGSYQPSISGNGRYVAYQSFATSLLGYNDPPTNTLPIDSNSQWDVFVYDRALETTTRVTVDSEGGQTDLGGVDASISDNGRFVSFSSVSGDYDEDDTNGTYDVYLHDRVNASTLRVSTNGVGILADGNSGSSSVSADGRYVAFDSSATNLVTGDISGLTDVFIHDMVTGETECVSLDTVGAESDGSSYAPDISDNGRWIAFESHADDLVADDTNNKLDVFVRDIGAY